MFVKFLLYFRLKRVAMKKIFLVIVSIFLLFAAEKEDFLKTLNEVTEIATISKLNIDKTPSNVEVIRRDFILKSGAKTLLDILKYLPGIEISMSSSGKKELIIRGNKSTYRDKIKFMINGVSVTNNLYSNQFYYYNFPAVLIKRIEFTKTPDSVLYGGNAFLGVINIITVDSLNNDFVDFYVSTKQEFSGAFFKKFKQDELLIDAHYSVSHPHLKSPTSYLGDIKKMDVMPYRSNVDVSSFEKNFGIGIKYDKEESNIKYRLEYYEKGNFFGISRLTPLKHDKKIRFWHQYLNFHNSKYLKYNLKNCFDAGIKYYIWDGEFRTFPYDFNETIDNNPDNDIISGAKINEIEYYIRNIIHNDLDHHNFVYLLEAKYAKPFDYYYLQYVPSMNETQNAFNLGPNGKHLKGKNNVLKEGINRKTFSSAFQDLIVFNENFSAVGGIRFDSYSDFGRKLSYKFGSVYSKKDYTLKILFNNAFRVPSWVELYAKSASDFNGNEKLKPETIDMLEVVGIKKIKNDRLKLVFFYGKNKNYIGRKIDLKSGKKIYDNLGTYYIRGIEASYLRRNEDYTFDISYSLNKNYYDFENKISGFNIYDWPGNREKLIKSHFIYNFDKDRSVFFGLIYGSEIKTPAVIKNIPSYFSINTNYRFKSHGFYFTIGADNITNHKNYYWVDPSDLIFDRYFFEFEQARIYAVGRKIFFNIYKEW